MKPQSRRQLLKLLTHWKSAFLQIEQTNAKLEAIFGVKPDAEIYTVLYATFHAYTEALSVLVGEEYSWLHWYCWDNDMGKKKLKANGKPIASLNDLLSLILGSK